MKVKIEFKMIDPKELKPNSWNPNEMSKSDYEHLKEEITRVGFIDPVCIMRNNIIVDGEHRWKAAIDLNLPLIPCIVLDTENIEEAKILTINLNKIKGVLNPAKVGQLILDLSNTYDSTTLETYLNMNQIEMSAYKQLLNLDSIDDSYKPPERDTVDLTFHLSVEDIVFVTGVVDGCNGKSRSEKIVSLCKDFKGLAGKK